MSSNDIFFLFKEMHKQSGPDFKVSSSIYSWDAGEKVRAAERPHFTILPKAQSLLDKGSGYMYITRMKRLGFF